MTGSADAKEFIFGDESGDPGLAGDPTYILAALHMSERVVHHVRYCDAAFRYHSQVTKEYKDQGWAAKIGPAGVRLLLSMADFTGRGEANATVIWLDKATYRANGGPYLEAGKSTEFRHFQLRLLLEKHRAAHPWGTRLDVVLDRWGASQSARRNLEDYLQGNYALRPQVETVTLVDSLYCDLIQIVDLYTRLARLVVSGAASSEQKALAAQLFVLHEVTGGLYQP
jgi:hypothetical protein